MKIINLRWLLICGGFTLALFYGYCLYLAANPNVSYAYRLYYIDKISRSPHIETPYYQVGSRIMTPSNEANKNLGKGWVDTQQGYMASDRKNAYLLFMLNSQSAQDLELTMQVQAAIHPERLTQGAEVYVNDVLMEKWKFSEEKNEIVNKRLTIPRSILKKTGLLTVRIKIEDPIYPNESDTSSRKYSPGIYLYWLQLNPTGD